LRAAVEQVEAELDGKGRVILRPSGTEPLVRVTLEGADSGLVERLARQLADTVRSELGA
jgi:phosphoglucosamine mutase